MSFQPKCFFINILFLLFRKTNAKNFLDQQTYSISQPHSDIDLQI